MSDTQANQDPYSRALFLGIEQVLREARSTAKRVPTDWRERAGYRKGLRQAARVLGEMAEFREIALKAASDLGESR